VWWRWVQKRGSPVTIRPSEWISAASMAKVAGGRRCGGRWQEGRSVNITLNPDPARGYSQHVLAVAWWTSRWAPVAPENCVWCVVRWWRAVGGGCSRRGCRVRTMFNRSQHGSTASSMAAGMAAAADAGGGSVQAFQAGGSPRGAVARCGGVAAADGGSPSSLSTQRWEVRPNPVRGKGQWW
jgi:hypothetical protein